MNRVKSFSSSFWLIFIFSHCSQMTFAQEEVSKSAYEIKFGGSHMKAGLSYNIRAKFVRNYSVSIVEHSGLEPLTSTLPVLRSSQMS